MRERGREGKVERGREGARERERKGGSEGGREKTEEDRERQRERERGKGEGGKGERGRGGQGERGIRWGGGEVEVRAFTPRITLASKLDEQIGRRVRVCMNARAHFTCIQPCVCACVRVCVRMRACHEHAAEWRERE